MATKECFLCTRRQLAVQAHPKSRQSAKLYADTLIKLLNFSITTEKELLHNNASLNLKTERRCFDDPLPTNSNDNAEKNPDFAINLEKNILAVTYCLKCINGMRKVNRRFKDILKIQQQILQYKNEIVELLVQHCSRDDVPKEEPCLQAVGKPSSPSTSTASTHHSVNSLRRDIVQGFNLRKSCEPTPEKVTRNVTVEVTRLEDIPEICSQFPNNISDIEFGISRPGFPPEQQFKTEPIFPVTHLSVSSYNTEADDDPFFSSTSTDHDHSLDLDDADDFKDLKINCEIPSVLLKPQRSKNVKKKTKKTPDKKLVAQKPKVSEEKDSSKRIRECRYEGCDFQCVTIAEIDLHMREADHGTKVLRKDFPCRHCDAKFVRKNARDRHEKYYHTTVWSCNECSIQFPSRSDFQAHQIKVHKKGFHCSLCPYIARRNYELLVHTRTVHQKEKNFVCQLCGLKFTGAQNLKYHCSSKHPELSDSPIDPNKYKCEQCNKIFAAAAYLKKHIATIHVDPLKYQCDICGKGFATKTKVKYHMLGHSNEKNFKCSICHARFLRKENLKLHMYRHTGDSKYICQICSKKFSCSGKLKRHEKIHERRMITSTI